MSWLRVLGATARRNLLRSVAGGLVCSSSLPLGAQEFKLPSDIPSLPTNAAPPAVAAKPAATAAPQQTPPANDAPAAKPTVEELSAAALQGEQLVAIVGREPILVADIRPRVEQKLKQIVGNQVVPEEELKMAREMLTRQTLVEYINIKIVYRGFIESISGAQTQDKARDIEDQVSTRARKYFYEQEIPKQIQDRKLRDINELDQSLRKSGSSIERLERQFVEAMVGSTFLNEQIPKNVPVTPIQLLDYYRDHGEEFDKPARAKWEQLSVLFSKHESKAAADAAIRAMGNEALFGGNMQAVAKKSSEEPLASKGGLHDWTRKGSLRSKVLDEAIFSLPVNKMSQIIEDDVGYHIVRVIEREEAGRTPFSQAQEEIKEKIQDRKREEMHERLVQKIRQAVPVWSIYPGDMPGAMPLSEVAAVPNLSNKK